MASHTRQPSRRGSAYSDPLRVVFRSLLAVAQKNGREITDLFENMFEEGEGKMSHDELRAELLSPEFGVAMQPEQIDQLISWIDVDSDGFIDKAELQAAEEVYRFTQGRRQRSTPTTTTTTTTSTTTPTTTTTPPLSEDESSNSKETTTISPREIELETLLATSALELTTTITARDKYETDWRKVKSKLTKVVDRWKKQNSKVKKLQQDLKAVQDEKSNATKTKGEGNGNENEGGDGDEDGASSEMSEVNADLMVELDRMRQKVSALEEEKDAINVTNKNLQMDINDTKEECDEWRQTVKDMQDQMDEMRGNANVMQEEQDKQRETTALSQSELIHAKETIQTLETQVTHLQTEQKNEQNVDEKNEDEKTVAMKKLTAQIQMLQTELNDSQEELHEVHSSSNSRAELLNVAHQTINELKTNLTSLQNLVEHQEDINIHQQLNDLKTNYRRLLDTKNTLEGHNNILKEENVSLKDMLRKPFNVEDEEEEGTDTVATTVEQEKAKETASIALEEKDIEILRISMELKETIQERDQVMEQMSKADENILQTRDALQKYVQQANDLEEMSSKVKEFQDLLQQQETNHEEELRRIGKSSSSSSEETALAVTPIATATTDAADVAATVNAADATDATNAAAITDAADAAVTAATTATEEWKEKYQNSTEEKDLLQKQYDELLNAENNEIKLLQVEVLELKEEENKYIDVANGMNLTINQYEQTNTNQLHEIKTLKQTVRSLEEDMEEALNAGKECEKKVFFLFDLSVFESLYNRVVIIVHNTFFLYSSFLF